MNPTHVERPEKLTPEGRAYFKKMLESSKSGALDTWGSKTPTRQEIESALVADDALAKAEDSR